MKNAELASLALGMGAAVSAVHLAELEEIGVDLAKKVETRNIVVIKAY